MSTSKRRQLSLSPLNLSFTFQEIRKFYNNSAAQRLNKLTQGDKHNEQNKNKKFFYNTLNDSVARLLIWIVYNNCLLFSK